MSTRGHIAIKKNGIYRCIFNHHDSHIDSLGITLYKYFDNADRATELINLGDTSSIHKELKNTAKSYAEHLARSIEERETVAEFRETQRWGKEFNNYDVTWEECQAFETEDIEDVLAEEYVYIFDADQNKWYIAYCRDKYALRCLEEVLHSKELLEQLFSKTYIEEYLPEFYEKCLNA